MDYDFYLNKFHLAITDALQIELENKGLKSSVDIVMESIALKIYKPEWSSNMMEPLEAVSRIFFSIWINDKTIQEEKMYYNIHALKLRGLKDYTISSKEFAGNFRSKFLKYQKDWPNVNVEYGPLTLMQGWVYLDMDFIQENVGELIHNFLKISPVIDIVLKEYKK